MAQRAEQRRRFKAVLCTKPRTYSRLKGERKRAEKHGQMAALAAQSFVEEELEEAPVLDGFFLVSKGVGAHTTHLHIHKMQTGTLAYNYKHNFI